MKNDEQAKCSRVKEVTCKLHQWVQKYTSKMLLKTYIDKTDIVT